MKYGVAAWAAAVVLGTGTLVAAGALAQAAQPFPEVPIPHVATHPHHWAYLTMATGAGLVATSFAFEARANHDYDRYLAATEPDQIIRLYRHTRFEDNLS